MGRKGLIYGVGINDADYVVKGKSGSCPYYVKWSSMIERCYSERELNEYPSYQGCKVCEPWLTFSNFKAWMETQDWEGKHLDKDLLGDGTLYSPETCCFILPATNMFLTERQNDRGKYLLGVHLHKGSGKFRSWCNNPYTKKQEHLGLFESEIEAHLAWKAKKHELSLQIADQETCAIVKAALRTRYLAGIQ